MDKIVDKIATAHKVFVRSWCVEAGGGFLLPLVSFAGLVSYSASFLSRNATTTFSHCLSRGSLILSSTLPQPPVFHVPMHADMPPDRTHPFFVTFFHPLSMLSLS
jgi:hypothetical protein